MEYQTTSIIVPVYNGEKSLPICLDSILAQTCSNWQVLLVDDGSTDRSPQICDQYGEKDSRIRVFHKENGGVSSARNMAMDNIQTEYFVCVDSDDSVEPDYLAQLMEARRQFPKAGHIWCCFQTVDSIQKENPTPHLLNHGQAYMFFDRSQIMELNGLWMAQMPWHRLYKTSVVERGSLRMEESMSLGEDLMFNLDYLDQEPDTGIVVVNQALYNYTCGSVNSLDHRYRADLLEVYERLDRYLRCYLEKWNVDKSQWDLFYNSCFYHYEKVLRNTYHEKNTDSPNSKRRYNNAILRSQAFRQCLDQATCFIHPAYRLAYQWKKYELVLLLDWVAKAKRKRR